MFVIFGFVAGLAGGAAATAAWLLSETGGTTSSTSAPADRLGELRIRFERALADGKHAGAETENRLRHELDAYRKRPDRPGTSH